MFDMIRRKTIKGKDVVIYLLPASKGITIAKQLMELFLPALGTAVETSKSEYGMDFQDVAMSVAANIGDLDEGVIKVLLNGCTVNGKEVNADFDNYFMGNYGELVSILEFTLKENFSSFFSELDFLDTFRRVPTEEQTEAPSSAE